MFQAEVQDNVFVCRLCAPTGEKPLSMLMLRSMSLHDRLRIWLTQAVLPTVELAAEACRAELTSSASCQHFAMSWLIMGLCTQTVCSPKVLQQLLAALAASIAIHSFSEYADETRHVELVKSCSLHFDNTMFCCCLTYIHCKYAATSPYSSRTYSDRL